jgi:Sulphur oxidation protein SoxZ
MLPIGTPRNAIQTLDCRYGGVEVFRANMSSGIAANPYLKFFLRARESGELACRWVDKENVAGLASADRDVGLSTSGNPRSPGSEKDQKTRGIIGQQLRHFLRMLSHQLLDCVSSAIAPSEPHNFGWRTGEDTALVEIGVLRHDDEPIGARPVPHSGIVGPIQSDLLNVRRLGKNVRQPACKSR